MRLKRYYAHSTIHFCAISLCPSWQHQQPLVLWPKSQTWWYSLLEPSLLVENTAQAVYCLWLWSLTLIGCGDFQNLLLFFFTLAERRKQAVFIGFRNCFGPKAVVSDQSELISYLWQLRDWLIYLRSNRTAGSVGCLPRRSLGNRIKRLALAAEHNTKTWICRAWNST